MLKKIIDNFIPKIFTKKNYFKYFYFAYVKNLKINGVYRFSREKYDRRALISAVIISKISKIKNIKYLEIGCDRDGTFNSIPLDVNNKTGVDPVRGGTHRMTSDKFFENNYEKFDIIFIDGLHTYSQTKKDFLNSLKVLNENGVIFFDDMLPVDWAMQFEPRFQGKSTGDVWKLAAEIFDSKMFDFKIIKSNYGIGVLEVIGNNTKIPDNDYSNLTFKEYLDYANNKFNIINSSEFIKNKINNYA